MLPIVALIAIVVVILFIVFSMKRKARDKIWEIPGPEDSSQLRTFAAYLNNEQAWGLHK
jgi:uncharacterized membrane protein YsdA (DUF1294 family)